eukprot:1157667-Pelagomonas_calceolata.AAC.1
MTILAPLLGINYLMGKWEARIVPQRLWPTEDSGIRGEHVPQCIADEQGPKRIRWPLPHATFILLQKEWLPKESKLERCLTLPYLESCRSWCTYM